MQWDLILVLDFWFVLSSGFIFWIDCSLPFRFVLAFKLCVCIHFDLLFVLLY